MIRTFYKIGSVGDIKNMSGVKEVHEFIDGVHVIFDKKVTQAQSGAVRTKMLSLEHRAQT